jgi:hypothetical protein
MIKISDIATGKAWPPTASDGQRVINIDKNRQLYNGNYSSIGLAPDQIISINFFHRVTSLYVDFLLSEGFTITSDEGTSEPYEDTKHLLQDLLYKANVNANRYGVGLVSFNPFTNTPEATEPDNWFAAADKGAITHDIIVRYFDAVFETDAKDNDKASKEIIQFQITDYKTNITILKTFAHKSGIIGQPKGDNLTIKTNGKMVSAIFKGMQNGQSGESAYNNVKDIVSDIMKSRFGLSNVIRKNINPHLSLPASVLKGEVDGDGTKVVKISEEGMAIPMQKDDAQPSYIQWESKVESVKYQTDQNRKDFYMLTSIPPIMFEGNVSGQASSGEALRRLMIPFVSNLNGIAENNVKLIKSFYKMLQNAQLTAGKKRTYPDVAKVEFHYKDIFEDKEGNNRQKGANDEETN